MRGHVVRLLFFGNYFVGLLAIVLSIEAAVQLQIPMAQPVYYLSLFLSVVLYYTYAYSNSRSTWGYNSRSIWYKEHKQWVAVSQKLSAILLIICTGFLLRDVWEDFHYLKWVEWLLLFSFPLAAISYYGLLPSSPISFNLRNTGWLKAFVIGFVWAGMVTIYPLYFQKLTSNITLPEMEIVIWFFAKNWMFCTINAIIFDMKDYASDANHELKTFVVRIGLRKTIYFVLLPLTLLGMTAMLFFTYYQGFSTIRIIINVIPFLCLLWVARSMHLRRNILYYLIVIDGMLLVKAVCGVMGVWVENNPFIK